MPATKRQNRKRPATRKPTPTKTKKPPKLPAAEQYQAEAEAAVNEWLDLMEQTWGRRPEVTVSVQPCLLATAEFHIKGFAHKGQRTYVHPDNLNRRLPKHFARSVAHEITSHRNTCQECGEGIAPLYARQQCMDGSYARLVHADGTMPWYPGTVRVDVLPDAVERKLQPKLAAEVERTVRARFGAAARDPKTLRYQIPGARTGRFFIVGPTAYGAGVGDTLYQLCLTPRGHGPLVEAYEMSEYDVHATADSLDAIQLKAGELGIAWQNLEVL